MRWLTNNAEPGDEMFLHYSGHGGQRPDRTGDESDGKDETLLPCDFEIAGQITDDDLFEVLVQDLPKGCKLWVILDCCHSGTALDLKFKMQISPDGRTATCQKTRSRMKYGAKVQRTQAEVLMLSGCKDSQTSADVQAGSLGTTKAAGAMTTALRHALTPTISCQDLLERMRSYLRSNQFAQVPQMSSEQFLQMDCSFVQYMSKRRGKRAIPLALVKGRIPPPLSTIGSPSINHLSTRNSPGVSNSNSYLHMMRDVGAPPYLVYR